MKVRKSVFSGSWYPGDAAGCEREIKGFLKEYGASGCLCNFRDASSYPLTLLYYDRRVMGNSFW